MNLDELLKKQQREQEAFWQARDRAWQAMKEDHAAITTAAGGEDRLYDDQKQRMAQDIHHFNQEWHSEDGMHFTQMQERQQQERRTNTNGKDSNGKTGKAGQPSSDRQALKEKLIEEQNAILRQGKKQDQPKTDKQQTANENPSPMTDREKLKQQFIEEQNAILEQARQRASGHSR